MWSDKWYNYSYYNNINDLNYNTSVLNKHSSSEFYDHDDNDYYSDHSIKSNNEYVFIPEKNSERMASTEVNNETKKVIEYAATS